MNSDSFAQLMGFVLAATGHKLDDDSIESWRVLLSDIPDSALSKAMKRAACECKAFPSVALIREYAADAQHGVPSDNADVWPKVLEAVRYFGYVGRDRAKAKIPPLVWKALGGDIGWEHLCEMEADQRATFAAQFRERYRELKASETRDRRLPDSLRPRIDNTPVKGLPEPKAALPAPEPTMPPTDAEMQEAWDRMERAKLSIFREPTEAKPVVDGEEFERRRQQQLEAAAELARRAAQ